MTHIASHLQDLEIETDGCCLVQNAISPDETERVERELSESLESKFVAPVSFRAKTFGARNLAAAWDGWRDIVDNDRIRQLLRDHVGERCGLVRVLYFDKPPGHGWSLPWHRDQTIAVDQHLEPLAPFSKPTTKAGVAHVEATIGVLQQMLTLRLSLDPMSPENGPLLVIPGSHRDAGELGSANQTAVELQCDAGDIFAMRPRILHASRKACKTADIHRRVIHMEFAPENALPEPWKWHTFREI